jgi:hypothetical protein
MEGLVKESGMLSFSKHYPTAEGFVGLGGLVGQEPPIRGSTISFSLLLHILMIAGKQSHYFFDAVSVRSQGLFQKV